MSIKCSQCGANMELKHNPERYSCPYCDEVIYLEKAEEPTRSNYHVDDTSSEEFVEQTDEWQIKENEEVLHTYGWEVFIIIRVILALFNWII